MSSNEIKSKIEKERNKNRSFLQQISTNTQNTIIIESILYSHGIYLEDIKSIDDLYDIVNWDVDPNIFNEPYYLTIRINNLDDNIINIINQIDKNIFIELLLMNDYNDSSLSKNISIKSLLNIKHKNCIITINCNISLDDFKSLDNSFKIDNDSYFTVVIDRIDSNTQKEIIELQKRFNRLEFKIEVKDINILLNISNIIEYMPNEIKIELDDNLFINYNSKNARDLLFTNKIIEIPDNKKAIIMFRDIEYNSIQEVINFERNIELIKSHIPQDANKLDIVTYISLFIINYFNYDYVMYKKIINDEPVDDINMQQFIIRKKGVCSHYAKFTEYILNSLGIECKELESESVYENDDYGHAFNIVTIDGKSYFLDNTWLSNSIKRRDISILSESSDFLTSNADFKHDEYKTILDNYKCESFDRNEINNSVNRVKDWNNNYVIHKQAILDLFRKHILMKNNIEQSIEEAIPRRI